MEEDPDESVERCASLLMSADRVETQAGINLLTSLQLAVETLLAAARFSRFLQELAAYRGGVVPERLLQPVLEGCETALRVEREAYRTMELANLSASKVVVERCLRTDGTRAEPDIARNLLLTFTHQTVGRARVLPDNGTAREVISFLIARSLASLVNFARGSKLFRDALRDSLAQRSLFEHFKDLLKAEFLNKLPADVARGIRLQLSSLAVCLAFSSDSQSWALDMGLLKVVAAIYEASPLKESQWEIAPAYRCNKLLLRLLMSESTTEKLRAHNALLGFRPHRRKINGAEPESGDFWHFFEGRLRGIGPKPDGIQVPDESWKCLEDICDASFPAFVVCSWKRCAAGREPAVGKGFSACGRCRVARYCSKEHQMLHWATHKVHCKEHPAGRSRLAEL